ncbi:hypothetical protein [Heyndrickxia vini]|uniref:hypothetical protein n=1 Tax=Heyndrickxia vini TaxID=1476025 RepID=UPI001FE8C067|nr:hypothetical protein [Heyndrickxia vini]
MLVSIIRISLVAASWISAIFLPKKSFIKFLPVTFFSACILLVENLLGTSRKWWKVKGGAKASANNALTFIFGPFFVGNIWIFHLTYRKFWLYTLINLLMDMTLAFPLNCLFDKCGLYKLKKFKPIHLFLTAFSYSFLNYGFQRLMDMGKDGAATPSSIPLSHNKRTRS